MGGEERTNLDTGAGSLPAAAEGPSVKQLMNQDTQIIPTLRTLSGLSACSLFEFLIQHQKVTNQNTLLINIHHSFDMFCRVLLLFYLLFFNIRATCFTMLLDSCRPRVLQIRARHRRGREKRPTGPVRWSTGACSPSGYLVNNWNRNVWK